MLNGRRYLWSIQRIRHWANSLGTTCVIGSDKQESIFNLTFVFEYLFVHWTVLGKKNSISTLDGGKKKKKVLPTNLAPSGRKFSQLVLITQGWWPDFEDLGETDFWKPVRTSWNNFQLSFLFLLGGPWVNDPGCLRCWGPAVCWWLLLADFGLRLSFKVLYIWFFFRDKYVGNHKPDVLLSLSVKVFLLPPKSKYQLYGWSPWHFLVQEISWPVSSGSCCSLQDVWVLFYKSDWSGAHGTWDRESMHV